MKKILLIILTIVTCISCSEDILDVKNEKSYDGSNFFTNVNNITEVSTAMYTPLLFQGMYSRDFYFIFDLLGNDADKNTPLQGDLLSLPQYQFSPNSVELTYFFGSCYKMSYRSNFVLDVLNKWETKTSNEDKLKDRITGEAKFIKSLAYFWLVTCYGDVPLKKTFVDHGIVLSERTPKAEIWSDIEANLTDAVDKLPLPQDYKAADYGRATKSAAVALLGKVYLYQKKYTDAITRLSSLTKAPYQHKLANSLDDIFIHDMKTDETIFAVMHGLWNDWAVGNAFYMFNGQETWGMKATHTGRAMEYGFNDWWNVLVSDALVDAFHYKDESGNDYVDPRAKLTYYSDYTQDGDTSYCDECDSTLSYPMKISQGQISWRKYEMYEMRESYGNPDSYINSQVIRYADVLLMLAECYIENNQVDNALPLINQVRNRSGAFLYTTLGDQANARSILRHERQIELAGEQSRFFDLVRWGILKETINAEKQASDEVQPVKDRHVLLPIPQSERDANPKLDAQVNNNWN